MNQIIPPIPKHFRQKSNVEFFKLFGSALFAFTVCSLCSMSAYIYFTLNRSVWTLVLLVPIIFLSTLIAGGSLNNMTTLAHDGGHGLLSTNFKLSFVLGVIASSVNPGYWGITYNEHHWPHHLFPNTEKDPQSVWMASSSVLKKPRVIALFILGAQTYFGSILTCIDFLKGTSKVPNLSLRQTKLLTVINILCNLAFSVLWLLLLKISTATFVLCFLIPYIFTFFWQGFVLFTDHGDTFLGFRNSWTHTHPLVRWIMANDNYHLEHHLYPFVQRSRLHEVHLYLKSIDFFHKNDCLVETQFWKTMKIPFVAKYPNFKTQDTVTWADIDRDDEKPKTA